VAGRIVRPELPAYLRKSPRVRRRRERRATKPAPGGFSLNLAGPSRKPAAANHPPKRSRFSDSVTSDSLRTTHTHVANAGKDPNGAHRPPTPARWKRTNYLSSLRACPSHRPMMIVSGGPKGGQTRSILLHAQHAAGIDRSLANRGQKLATLPPPTAPRGQNPDFCHKTPTSMEAAIRSPSPWFSTTPAPSNPLMRRRRGQDIFAHASENTAMGSPHRHPTGLRRTRHHAPPP
jgi:hypothetical protein